MVYFWTFNNLQQIIETFKITGTHEIAIIIILDLVYPNQTLIQLFVSSQTSSNAGLSILINSHSIHPVAQIKSPGIILDFCSHQLHAVICQQILSCLFLKNTLMTSSFYHNHTGLSQHHFSPRVLQQPSNQSSHPSSDLFLMWQRDH